MKYANSSSELINEYQSIRTSEASVLCKYAHEIGGEYKSPLRHLSSIGKQEYILSRNNFENATDKLGYFLNNCEGHMDTEYVDKCLYESEIALEKMIAISTSRKYLSLGFSGYHQLKKEKTNDLKKNLSLFDDKRFNRKRVRSVIKMLDTRYGKIRALSMRAEIALKLIKEAKTILEAINDQKGQPGLVMKYDVFISHATDDKEGFVRPLAELLRGIGIKVWYDEFELQLGDSLREKIDLGLKDSKFGLVILSSSFFGRPWASYELNGFVSRELNESKIILPIWHEVTKDEVINFSPTLADKVAIKSSELSLEEIAAAIKGIVERT